MKINFIPSSKEVEAVVPMPKSAKSYLPEWYKNIRLDKDIKFNDSAEPSNINVKACMPFLDSLTQGYIQESWCDLYIKVKDGVTYMQSTGPEMLINRPHPGIQLSEVLAPHEFAWKMQWIPKLPKGWSVMITSPLNRFDLPFQVASGIIDSDVFYHTYAGNVPFYMKDGFEGVIPAGTPLYQMIPIKRASWSSYAVKYNEEVHMKRNHQIRKKFIGAYKKFFWQKKSFI